MMRIVKTFYAGHSFAGVWGARSSPCRLQSIAHYLRISRESISQNIQTVVARHADCFLLLNRMSDETTTRSLRREGGIERMKLLRCIINSAESLMGGTTKNTPKTSSKPIDSTYLRVLL